MIIMGELEFRNYVQDHDLFELICGNDQATRSHVVQFGDDIGTHMDHNVDSRRRSQTDGHDDMFFEETDYHYNMTLPIYNQSESAEPRGASSTQSRKEKEKMQNDLKS
ncbi:hypothetical protein IHE45_10G016300 [Dioscorea alata]|uniref:Uncharacterized protein n=1 Tax=Dioscorea alata TaxID=55571 RepID=A0ACB7V957_DIOAL|nr:hypothetical protein IHE45_10G016300 [Dioscorea alata]